MVIAGVPIRIPLVTNGERFSPGTVLSYATFAIYGAEPWLSALLHSSMHMAWVKTVGGRMLQMREEEAFQTLLAKWKADLEIVTYPENLVGLKSWHDLVVGPPPENPVPRNS